MSTELDPTWSGLVDDAAIFPPGNAALPEATAAYADRDASQGAGLVGAFVLTDKELPLIRGFGAPLSVVITGGAGQIEGPARLCRKLGLDLVGLEIALRDLDDLVGNAQRVIAAVHAARDAGALDPEVSVSVELPPAEPTHQWLAAADEVAGAELRLKFRTGGQQAHQFPTSRTLAAWIDAALDRETPFKCTAGLHRALRHTGDDGFEHHGFLNVLVATLQAFDGASPDDVISILEQRQLEPVDDLVRARRWFTSFGSCSVAEPLADLRELGLVA